MVFIVSRHTISFHFLWELLACPLFFTYRYIPVNIHSLASKLFILLTCTPLHPIRISLSLSLSLFLIHTQLFHPTTIYNIYVTRAHLFSKALHVLNTRTLFCMSSTCISASNNDNKRQRNQLLIKCTNTQRSSS